MLALEAQQTGGSAVKALPLFFVETFKSMPLSCERFADRRGGGGEASVLQLAAAVHLCIELTSAPGSVAVGHLAA